ncbi:ribbon-helix-helix domain-containing protein [Campylobacter fetus]|uniref:ribbon-helix-helix domain-containing protein n=1 Tax=Campylobacter fetus TaxID=196 RepID=UPI0008188E85|nr:ribbon-helix-helix domain-containing protein [Campylobacter fetus]OCR84612.1 hypothetical protein CFT12S05168_08980 [Campylobacter fetus subsp. testudinum]OCR95661.1 hypothetical protein CFT12S02847_07570 [Campylobacter fetus subsp. testudinum]
MEKLGLGTINDALKTSSAKQTTFEKVSNKKLGRKPKKNDEKMTKHIAFYITNSQFESLEKLASENGYKDGILSRYVRDIVLNHIMAQNKE